MRTPPLGLCEPCASSRSRPGPFAIEYSAIFLSSPAIEPMAVKFAEANNAPVGVWAKHLRNPSASNMPGPAEPELGAAVVPTSVHFASGGDDTVPVVSTPGRPQILGANSCW